MLSENKYWKFVENESNFREENSFGKWLISSPWNKVEETWKIISNAVENSSKNDLCVNSDKNCSENNSLNVSSAKVSKKFAGNKSKNASICIYTYQDNMHLIREQLRNLGFIQPLCYKANQQTEKLLYGHFSHYICEKKKND